MKLSSDLCAGISLLGLIMAVPAALLGFMLLISKNSWALVWGKTLTFFGALPVCVFGLVVFVIFYRESKRVKQVEAEEELIRKLALEKLEKDKLRS